MKTLLALLLALRTALGFAHGTNITTNGQHSIQSVSIPSPAPSPTMREAWDTLIGSTPTPTSTLENSDYPIQNSNNEVPTPADTPEPVQQYNYAVPTNNPHYQYQEPTPAPEAIYQPTNKTCTTNGNYTYCSDGSSYITSGSYTAVNGGINGKSGSCITSGSYSSCSDGSSAIQNGNYSSYSGNGKNGTCIKNGARTNCSDGSSTYNSNY